MDSTILPGVRAAHRAAAALACGLVLVARLGPAQAQEPLTLADALRVAESAHPALAGAEARRLAAAAAARETRAGHQPRVTISESFQRGDNPVYVFGTLLNQRRFTGANFDLGALNRPSPVNNFQTALRVEQTVFDGFRTRSAARAAHSRIAMADERHRGTTAAVVRRVVERYFGAVLARATLAVADEAVRTADADLERATATFDAGLATEADVLSVRAHRAGLSEEQIRARYAVAVAEASLNDALGVDLDARYRLDTPLTPPALASGEAPDYERLALDRQPELREARFGAEAAAHVSAQADAARWPEVVAHGALALDRPAFADSRGSSWMAGVGLRWTLWDGAASRAAAERARHARDEAEAATREVTSAVRLAVRRALAEVAAAGERIEVARAAVASAEASHAIIQNRYEAGLTVVTELIRSETALLEARLRRLAALYDLRVSRVALDEATGTLTAASSSVR